MSYALYGISAWISLGTLLIIGSIGKQRKPLTPGMAAFIVAIQAGITVVLVLAARRLS